MLIEEYERENFMQLKTWTNRLITAKLTCSQLKGCISKKYCARNCHIDQKYVAIRFFWPLKILKKNPRIGFMFKKLKLALELKTFSLD